MSQINVAHTFQNLNTQGPKDRVYANTLVVNSFPFEGFKAS